MPGGRASGVLTPAAVPGGTVPHHRRILLACAAAALAAALQPPARASSSSPRFVLKSATTGAAGATSSSGNYALSATLSQEVTVGTSSSRHFVLQSGFWSFVGSGLVPVHLFVNRNSGNPEHVDLKWTGNNPPYDVYQSADCTDVFGTLYGTTPSNAYPDVVPPPAPLVCYSTLATAPGPEPPPPATP
jgi:hypothetical protein